MVNNTNTTRINGIGRNINNNNIILARVKQLEYINQSDFNNVRRWVPTVRDINILYMYKLLYKHHDK